MKRYIVLSILAVSLMTAFAQEDAQKYRRSSIYSLMINHTDQQFAKEIKEAFLQIPVPDKFNDHNLSVKVVNMDKKLAGAKKEQENATVTDFLEKNKIASRLVGRWFNRDFFTGQCDMELVKERGLYNANEFDKQLATRSARGMAMLQDAGEELIGNTFDSEAARNLRGQQFSLYVAFIAVLQKVKGVVFPNPSLRGNALCADISGCIVRRQKLRVLNRKGFATQANISKSPGQRMPEKA